MNLLPLIFLLPTQTNSEEVYYERALHDKLLKGYNKNIRPVLIFGKAIDVNFGFVLEEVNSLDVKEQTLDVNAFITLSWNDPQLIWNISEFGGIDDTVMDPKFIWTPDVSLYNTGDSSADPLTYVYKKKIKLESDGNLTLVSYSNWKSSCSTDVTWWPFDKHKCVLKFGSLMYDNRRLSLKRGPMMSFQDHMKKQYYGVNSGEWITRDISSFDKSSKLPRGEVTTVNIAIKLTRMPLYYLLYTIFPLCALILTFLLVFHLDIGQRASYGVAILLSISVYLMAISENLPLKSDNPPFLGVCFVIQFFLLCVAVPIAEFGAHIAQRSEGIPPSCLMWIMKLTKGCIFNCPDKCKRKAVTDDIQKCEDIVRMNNVPEDVTNASCLTNDEEDYHHEDWRELGRFLDVSFSILFLMLLILAPVIVTISLD